MEEYEDLYYCAKEAATHGRYFEAAQLYRRVAKEVPLDKQPTFWLLAAEAHNDAYDIEEAIADCKKAISLDPYSAKAWRVKGRLLMEAGDNWGAKQDLCKSLDLSPTTSAHIYLSQVCIKDGDLVDAENHCREALFLSPSFDEALYNLGLVLKMQGHVEQALDAFYEAVNVSPNYAIAFREIGIIQFDQGDYDKAEENLKISLSITPTDKKTLRYLTNLP